jgi:hypothetical protein
MYTSTTTVAGLTDKEIERLCLSELVSVDTRFDEIKSIITLSGDNYWLELYRLCAEFLTLTINPLEYAAITCLYQLVCYKISTPIEGDEGRVILRSLLEQRVTQLQYYK